LESNFIEILKFVQSNSIPIIDEIGPHNFKIYSESSLPLVYFFVDVTVPNARQENLDKVYEIAKSTKGKLNWVIIDWSKYAKHSERLGLSGQVHPAIAIENMADGRHYAYDEKAAITTDTIRGWIDQFIKGEIQPTIKSEPVPASNDGPVKVLVATNFEEIVNDATKDVLVEFYAPWCGHCKKLTPIYEELGTLFKSKSNVVIAKIDATANDVSPSFNVRGFPTLKFFPATNKKPIDYEGDRSLEDLKSFVEKHLTNSGGKDEL